MEGSHCQNKLLHLSHPYWNLNLWPCLNWVFTNAQNWQYWYCIPIYFHLNLHHLILINMKLDIRECNRITFQGCRLHWSSSFAMVQLKRSWQYWQSCCGAESLWKYLMFHDQYFFAWPVAIDSLWSSLVTTPKPYFSNKKEHKRFFLLHEKVIFW